MTTKICKFSFFRGKDRHVFLIAKKYVFLSRANAFKFQYFFRYKSRSDDILLTVGFSPWIETRRATPLQSPARTTLSSLKSAVPIFGTW